MPQRHTDDPVDDREGYGVGTPSRNRGSPGQRRIAPPRPGVPHGAAEGGVEEPSVAPHTREHQVFRERRFHSPRAESMMARPPVTPSATRVQMKKRPPGDLATAGVNPLFRWMMGMPSAASPPRNMMTSPALRSASSNVPHATTSRMGTTTKTSPDPPRSSPRTTSPPT